MLNHDFKELMLPSPNGPNWWYVEAVQFDLFLRTDWHGSLSTFTGIIGKFYFDSEADALEEMLVYYNFHNESFPYVDEYRAAKNMIPSAALPANNAQSQKMEFV